MGSSSPLGFWVIRLRMRDARLAPIPEAERPRGRQILQQAVGLWDHRLVHAMDGARPCAQGPRSRFFRPRRSSSFSSALTLHRNGSRCYDRTSSQGRWSTKSASVWMSSSGKAGTGIRVSSLQLNRKPSQVRECFPKILHASP